MNETELDVRGVVAKFGGRAQLFRKLCLAGIDISYRTIDNWLYHGIIPMQRYLQLIDLARANGIKLQLETKTKKNNEKQNPAPSAANRKKQGSDQSVSGAQHSS
jgi:hypothetical protein